jgi:hypothetical protein
LYWATVVLNDESVFGNADGLNPCMKDVVYGRYVSPFGDSVDLIKETMG